MLALFVTQPGFAQRTVRMNLERLVQDAGVIIRGTVTKVESRQDKQTGHIATFVTLRVADNFYGATGEEVTFKVYAGRSGKLKLADMPRFEVGEESYSFWASPSRIGFSSPIGMQQGKFSLKREPATGKTLVSNGLANSNLFVGMKNRTALAKASWTEVAEPSIEASDFDATIRALVAILKKK